MNTLDHDHSIAQRAPDQEGAVHPRWHAAEALVGRNISVWLLERAKAAAEDDADTAPDSDSKKPNFKRRFGNRIFRTLAFGGTAILAFGIFVGYLVLSRLWRRAGSLPDNATRIVAVHGEWSTRTSHVLEAVPQADPPVQAIILVGRQSQSASSIARMWVGKLPELNGLCVLAPVSFRAAWGALRDLPALFREGLRVAIATDQLLGLREELALAFRVLVGATNGRWWEQQAVSPPIEVLFGCTGTADTTLLEAAIQKAGGHTVHLVHGQAIGPNFLGISDCALFRSKFDATAYNRLGCYGISTVQIGKRPKVRRGRREILLLSNLAHPMNPGFRRTGITDELNLLACVGRAAELLMLDDVRLSWKPHPVTYQLAPQMVEELRTSARMLGFREVPKDTLLANASEDARWVICSPSTAATDLLQIGTLSIVLDPQHSIVSTALSAFPFLSSLQPEALAALMAELDFPETYEEELNRVYSRIQPAVPLDLAKPLIQSSSGP